MRGLAQAVDCLIFVGSWAHVVLAPYTKVEESFNLHVAHDALMYGLGPGSLANYDHNIFPGVVPRTFVGSVLLSWIAMPFIQLGVALGIISSKFDVQLILRLILASLNAFAIILIRRAVSTRFGKQTSYWFLLLTCSQFHLPFWMGRTIPNMFALIPVNLAYYMLNDLSPSSTRPSQKSINISIALLTFTAVVFRSEVALLLAPLVLHLLVQGHTTFVNLLGVGLVVGLTSAAITVAVDSYFWNQWPLWPELYGLYFNVYLGKSADWGTSPAHTYFAAYLPKLLLGATPMAIVGAALDHRIRSLLLAPLAFVLALSALGHKEWRFVVYVVPLINIAAARGARWMTTRKKGFLLKYLMFLFAISLVALNFVATFASALASMENYPGGAALAAFNRRYSGQENIHVHISNLAAQTGASLFLHEHASPFLSSLQLTEPSSSFSQHSWIYNKTESLTPAMISSSSFTHMIAESPDMAGEEWAVVETIAGFQRWRLNVDLFSKLKTGRVWEIPLESWGRLVQMERSDQLWILERR